MRPALTLLALLTPMLAAAEETPPTVTAHGAIIYGDVPRKVLPLRVRKEAAGELRAAVTDGTARAIYELVDQTLGIDLDGVGGQTVIRRAAAPLHTKGWQAEGGRK